MAVRFHQHALDRMAERGTNEAEVHATIIQGNQFTARLGRMGFRQNFPFDSDWLGRHYETKQIEVYAVHENGDWLVITVLVKYF